MRLCYPGAAVGNARVRPIVAWGVHLYTALGRGAVVGVWALLAIAQGAWRRAVLLMLVGLFVDSTDGMMARALRRSPGPDPPLRRPAPRRHGRLPELRDRAGGVPGGERGCCPTGPGRRRPCWPAPTASPSVQAKTEDDFFLGFPSYWNIVAIYAWLLGLSAGVTMAIVVGLSVLAILVPFKYVYARGRLTGLAPHDLHPPGDPLHPPRGLRGDRSGAGAPPGSPGADLPALPRLLHRDLPVAGRMASERVREGRRDGERAERTLPAELCSRPCRSIGAARACS